MWLHPQDGPLGAHLGPGMKLGFSKRELLLLLLLLLPNRGLINVCVVKALVFPVVTYGWESWTFFMKAEYRIIDAFEMWC